MNLTHIHGPSWKLTELEIRNCPQLQALPPYMDEPGKKLVIDGCPQLKQLPFGWKRSNFSEES
jgi:hypothetical protein